MDGLICVTPRVGRAQPDGSLQLTIELLPTAYRFQRGHRLRLMLASAAHPRWNRNLGTGEPEDSATRMAVADQTIYRDDERTAINNYNQTSGAGWTPHQP